MKRCSRFKVLLLLAAVIFFIFPSGARANLRKTYSFDIDFDEGILNGVENTTVSDQLQLSGELAALPYIWVANSDESTVSKINTFTGKELGRYRTGPGTGAAENPSRIAVDSNGDIWIGNTSSDTAIKIALYPTDLNGDGLITTSVDLNGNGLIDSYEILPWGDDEAVLEVIENVDIELSALVVDAHNNVWIVGSYGSMNYYDGQTGTLLKNIFIGLRCYDALIDGNGTLWVSNRSVITRLDNPNAVTSVNPFGSHTISFVYADNYGLAIDKDGYIYSSGYDDNKLRKYDPVGKTWIYQVSIPGGNTNMGVTIGLDGDVWVAHSDVDKVTRHDASNGSLKAAINVGDYPTDIATDSAGKIWVTNCCSDNVMRINPATNLVEFTLDGHLAPCNYGDMTGIIARNITTKIGTWNVIFDGVIDNKAWENIYWSSAEPFDTSIIVKVRSSNDLINWSSWEITANGTNLNFTPDGRYLEIETILHSRSADVSPILYDLTINTLNEAPVLNAIGNKPIDEGIILLFTISAQDPDNDPLIYSATGLPTGASFNPATRTFSWTPDYTQAKTYPVTFTVTDNGTPSLTDSETITITVNNKNQAPILNTIGNKPIDEGIILQFTISALDPDGDSLTYSAKDLPAGADFNPATRTFSWTPDYTQAGPYIITFTVADNGTPSLTGSETITITVNNKNQAPILNAIGNKPIDEGIILQFTISAQDPDNDPLIYSATDLPAGASFDPATRTFSWTPDYTQAGPYTITFTVADNGTPSLTGSETITITVNNKNRAPILNAIGNKPIDEGSILQFTISAQDPDNDPLTYSATGLPAGASFNPATCTFSWTPDYTQAGPYTITFTVADNGTPSLTDSETITITVNNKNQAPILNTIGNKPIDEGIILQFTISAQDPDNDPLTYSATGLPTGASFNPATRTFSWTPDYTQAGPYTITFTVADNGAPSLSDSETITITVNNKNQAPILNAIGNKTIDEGIILQFTISALDPDGDSLTYFATGLPTGASFDPATHTFSWIPDYTQAETYPVKFTVADNGTPSLTDSETITITVNNIILPPINQAPVFDPIGNKPIDEGILLQFTISALDPDGDSLTYSATGLPTGASFDPATRTFSWTPGYTQAGPYTITFTVADNGTPSLTDSETITITVNNIILPPINQAPVLDPIGTKTIDERSLLQFTISAQDPDNDPLTYSATGLPTGASFDPATRTFSWTPGYSESGNYSGIKFEVTDGNLVDKEEIIITVDNVNRNSSTSFFQNTLSPLSCFYQKMSLPPISLGGIFTPGNYFGSNTSVFPINPYVPITSLPQVYPQINLTNVFNPQFQGSSGVIYGASPLLPSFPLLPTYPLIPFTQFFPFPW